MASPPFRVKALYEYVSPHDDDLSFPNGQVLTVTDEEDADWYYGEYEDTQGKKQEGLFPRNFVQRFEPETPPRPSRLSRSKKEMEPQVATEEAEDKKGTQEPEASSPPGVPAPPLAEEVTAPEQPSEEAQQPAAPPPAQSSSRSLPPPAPPGNAATKPVSSPAAKPAPPPVTEKPASGSFRDRINAFNKSTAPPVAPMKPSGLGGSGGSGFIKKPFVAPPPSKNAYVPPPREPPPQKVYRREEDPDVVAQTSNDVDTEDQMAIAQAAASTDDSENQPKPTSLKDRIALLQKQQMEQAARHAEAGQKKEKPRRPKKQVDPEEQSAEHKDQEWEELERIGSNETTGKHSIDASRDVHPQGARPTARPRKSREEAPVESPAAASSKEIFSDANDADQSGAGDTEEGEEVSTGRDDSDEKPQRQASIPLQRPPQALHQGATAADAEDNADEEDQDEKEEDDEEEVDPEVKRRMEIRDRMAKMSGGMGMAGMFGPPGAIPPKTNTKQGSASSEKKASGNSISGTADSPVSRAPPVPVMPTPGLQKVRSPEQTAPPLEVGKDEADVPKFIVQGRDPEDVPDVEDIQNEALPPKKSVERAAPPPAPKDRPVPAPPSQGRVPPPLPTERPVPPPPSTSRPVPPPPPSQPMSPSEGSESDDELSTHTKILSLERTHEPDSSQSVIQEGAPQMYSAGPRPSLPSRPQAPPSRISDYTTDSAREMANQLSPSSPTISPKRSSRVPPIPGSSPAIPSAPQSRAPPPPPPTAAPPSRVSTGDVKMLPGIAKSRGPEVSDEETTEYDGDYDTDMASGATHKDALKSHARVASLEYDSTTEETSMHHSGLPSIGPLTSNAPRAVPPPPPNQPPRNQRQSWDMPRAAPPPPPPSKEQAALDQDEDYDPYKYTGPSYRTTSRTRVNDAEAPNTPNVEDPENMYSASPPRRSLPTPTAPVPESASSPNMTVPGRSGPRQSSEIQRTSTSIRRSTDVPRTPGEHGFIASDVDLGQKSRWWTQPGAPPPVFQNRRDAIFETEETSTTRRGGNQTVTRVVYVLFMDYSQTIVTAHFEARDPSQASFEQRHEPPPRNLRQDQLEDAHSRFGTRIAEGVNTKKETVVGDGSPHALVLDLISSLPDALLPVGVRAYGALVYANLANASVQQFDEIRPGDIVTFRNTKFQGHRGPMHSKYSIEVGKPDHVGVVIDWDGTKKKVRVWEQGKESKKVKPESYKFGDMRSGEVKVWRVMARSWVGWEGQH